MSRFFHHNIFILLFVFLLSLLLLSRSWARIHPVLPTYPFPPSSDTRLPPHLSQKENLAENDENNDGNWGFYSPLRSPLQILADWPVESVSESLEYRTCPKFLVDNLQEAVRYYVSHDCGSRMDGEAILLIVRHIDNCIPSTFQKQKFKNYANYDSYKDRQDKIKKPKMMTFELFDQIQSTVLLRLFRVGDSSYPEGRHYDTPDDTDAKLNCSKKMARLIPQFCQIGIKDLRGCILADKNNSLENK